MQLHLIPSRVEPAAIILPSMCPYEDCDGVHFQFLQEVDKPLRDTQYPQVVAHRYECLRCHRTFRVYPQGVTKDHILTDSRPPRPLQPLVGPRWGEDEAILLQGVVRSVTGRDSSQ